MNKSKSIKFSILHVAIVVLMSIMITLGICRMIMNSKVDVLSEKLHKQKDLNNSYSDLLRANEDAVYHYEKEYVLEKERSKKLEKQLEECCPSNTVEEEL